MTINHAPLKPLHFYSASEIVSKIKNGEISSVEIVEAYYAQIEKHNATYNAIITLNKTKALENARAADEAIKEGKSLGLLHGLPITVKDTYETAGIKTTSGFPPLADYIPETDATVVSLLKNEGAIIIGKTNAPTLAMDLQTNNPLFGITNNPWDISRTCGGSSGGCASALASGMTALSFGSDLAGSIRQPSSYCGVYGLKPTYGVISKKGHIPPPPGVMDGLSSLAVLGPLARSIDDLELALRVIANSSESDRLVSPLSSYDSEKIDITKMKIAWSDNFGDVPVDTEIIKELKRYITKLESAGATVVKVDNSELPYKKLWHMWGRLLGLMMNHDKSNFKRRLLRFLTKKANQNKPMLQKIFDPISVTTFLKVRNKQLEYINNMDNFLAKYDAWISPVSSTTAFKHIKPTKKIGINYIYETPIRVNTTDVDYWVANTSYTIIANVTESPVVSMPIGLDSHKLPIGIQVTGQRFNDFRLLNVAKTLAEYADDIKYPLMED